MIKNKLFIVGFISGSAFCLLLTYVFIFLYPPLFTEQAKLSYALGQQTGSSPRVKNLNVSAGPFLAALKDAKNDYSRLSPEELSESRRLLMQRRDEQGRPIARPEFNDKVNAEGFFTSPRGVQFKLLSDGKKEIQSLREIMSSAKRSNRYEFTMSVTDSTGQEIHSPNKKLNLSRQEIPRELFEVLSYLDKNERLEVKLTASGLEDLSRFLSKKIEPNFKVQLQRISVEIPSREPRKR